jgi:hypothetical protein
MPTPLWVHAARALLGVIFLSGGLSKLVPGFPSILGLTDLIAVLEPHGLGLFARFVAVSEVTVGLLLLSHRLATLGAIMVAPMLDSFLVVALSLGWPRVPMIVVALLLLDAVLLLYDYPKWRGIFAPRDGNSEPPIERGRRAPEGRRGIAELGRDLSWWTVLALIVTSPLLVPADLAPFSLFLVWIALVCGLLLVERIRATPRSP